MYLLHIIIINSSISPGNLQVISAAHQPEPQAATSTLGLTRH